MGVIQQSGVHEEEGKYKSFGDSHGNNYKENEKTIPKEYKLPENLLESTDAEKVITDEGKFEEEDIKEKNERNGAKVVSDESVNLEEQIHRQVTKEASSENSRAEKDVDKVSKELEYMVEEYDTLSTENSQLRERVTQLEIEKKEV